ncbi:hypothetical protein ONZ51_g12830 [Trametes cubensis]|uniref:Uncharacterized protein n=1 Tax=Trametes cubensis TaxID=1111947 RepID=A0AAD7X3D6_9APHY|nr:hypothetical protein ONZ51_g12830 [Trametes cubensis]
MPLISRTTTAANLRLNQRPQVMLKADEEAQEVGSVVIPTPLGLTLRRYSLRPLSSNEEQIAAACTFTDPSHKRGPPKGYILALERRLHQVEALLGTIIGSDDPRARSLVQDLSRDKLASHIIQKVHIGPFGPGGRTNNPFSTTKEDFLASITRDLGDTASEQSGSSQDASNDLAFCSPSSDWQDQLKTMLHSARIEASSSMLFNTTSSQPDTKMRRATYPSATTPHQPMPYLTLHSPPVQAPASGGQYFDYRPWAQNSGIRTSANEVSPQPPHTMIPNIYTDTDGRFRTASEVASSSREVNGGYSSAMPPGNTAAHYYDSFRR